MNGSSETRPTILQLCTLQMATRHKFIKAYPEGVFLDTTVKSGEKRLAPTWQMVLRHKEGGLDDETYTQMYRLRMRDSLKTFPEFWRSLLPLQGEAKLLGLACYCRAGHFCHRHLLQRILTRYALSNGISVEHLGEYTPAAD